MKLRLSRNNLLYISKQSDHIPLILHPLIFDIYVNNKLILQKSQQKK